MKLFLRILFFIFAIFQINVGDEKVFEFESIILESIHLNPSTFKKSSTDLQNISSKNDNGNNYNNGCYLIARRNRVLGAGALKGVFGKFFGNNAAKGGLQYSDDLLKAAQHTYPKLAGKTQLHHITPKYLGGPANGPLIKLDAAYHQQITNAFRKLHPYNLPKPNAAELEILKNKVYSQFPLHK